MTGPLTIPSCSLICSIERDDLVGIDVVADGELSARDHTLGLEADVEQHFVAVDLHHPAGHDVAVVELDDGRIDRIREGETTEVVEDDELVGAAFFLTSLFLAGLFAGRFGGGLGGGFRNGLGHCAVLGDGGDCRLRHVLLRQLGLLI
jgi:hypothetical protein